MARDAIGPQPGRWAMATLMMRPIRGILSPGWLGRARARWQQIGGGWRATGSTPPATTPATPETPDGLLRRLQWTVLRPLASRLGGDERSLVRGFGLELSELREYQPGDDVRHIDWNTTARTDRPYVREAYAERALDVWLVVDVSPSVDWGTARCLKRDLAVELAARLACCSGGRATASGRCCSPSDRVPSSRRAPGGRTCCACSPASATSRAGTAPVGPTLTAALAQIRTFARRPSLILIVSDFLVPDGWQAALGPLAHRHEVVAVRLRDPREAEIPDVGLITLEDPETGDQLLVDTGDRRLRERFAEAAAAQDERIRAELVRRGVDQLVLSTAEDLGPALAPLPGRPEVPARPYRRPSRAAPGGITRSVLFHLHLPIRRLPMSFEWPVLLYGLAFVPIMAALYVLAQRRRRAYAVRFTNLPLLREVAPRRPAYRRHLPPLFFLLGMAALLLSLARPSAVIAVPRDQSSVMLVLDVSGSMSADDLQPDRMTAARQAARTFVEALPDDVQVGLVSFSNAASVRAPLGRDRDAVLRAIDALRPDGGTAIGEGLDLALDQLARLPAGRTEPGLRDWSCCSPMARTRSAGSRPRSPPAPRRKASASTPSAWASAARRRSSGGTSPSAWTRRRCGPSPTRPAAATPTRPRPASSNGSTPISARR